VGRFYTIEKKKARLAMGYKLDRDDILVQGGLGFILID